MMYKLQLKTDLRSGNMVYDNELTPEEWEELRSYQRKTMEIISQNVKQSFEAKKQNSFSYKPCSITNESEKMPKKMPAKCFSA